MTTKITEKNISNLANIGVQWQSVFVGDGSTGLTAVAGRGYFINTTSGAVTVTLPASPSAGDVVVLKDYARTWGINNVTLASALFDGVTLSNTFSTNGQTITLVYMDNTKGWSIINEDTTTSLGNTYISATGGTITTSGNYKIHRFTGDGCFVVSQVGTGSGPSIVDYLVVAGGGGGGATHGSGGGAGGFRESHSTCNSGCYTASPLATPTGITVTATTYPITVGGGGTGASAPSTVATSGSNSIFSTITSAGGGRGALQPGTLPGGSGGSGGGSSSCGASRGTVGAGNTPPVSPPQGNPGGSGGSDCSTYRGGGGGGGATAAGTAVPNGGALGDPENAGPGGAGATTSISGSPTAYAGGGGGGSSEVSSTGGTGGGGAGVTNPGTGGSGTANTGGGAGGGGVCGGTGGKGIVIIRYKYQ